MTTRKNNPTEEPADRVLVITRVFNAPRSLVFKAWTPWHRLSDGWTQSLERLEAHVAKAGKREKR